MTQVLDKAFSILELLTIASPSAVKPGEVATLLNINNATCSRILKDLSNAGYVEKISREAGYAIGPRAFTFSKQVYYNTDLINTAEPHIEECARKLGVSVILAELKNNQRYILSHHNYYRNSKIKTNKFSYTDLFQTATGVLLLAYASMAERENAVKQYGLPTINIFAEVSDNSGFHKLLDKIKNKSYAYYDKKENDISIYAVPVFKGEKMVAALGVTFIGVLAQDENKKSILEEVNRTAKKINKALSPINDIG